jgi:hypothetical protein
VRAQFDNADNALFPNQFVKAVLLVKTLHNVVTVPTAAIQRGAPGSYVYVINADNRVSVRPVNIGPTDGPMAQRSIPACRSVSGRRHGPLARRRARDHAGHTEPSVGGRSPVERAKSSAAKSDAECAVSYIGRLGLSFFSWIRRISRSSSGANIDAEPQG